MNDYLYIQSSYKYNIHYQDVKNILTYKVIKYITLLATAYIYLSLWFYSYMLQKKVTAMSLIGKMKNR